MKRFIILAALLIAGCNGSKSVTPSQSPAATPEALTPQSVAEQYLQAAKAGDTTGILTVSCHNNLPALPKPQQWTITGVQPTADSNGSYMLAIATIDDKQWGIEVWESEAFYQLVLALTQKNNEGRRNSPALGLPQMPLPDRAEFNADQYCIREVKQL